MSTNTALEALSKEQLIELVELCSKNLIAIDGTWFQSVEDECGMDAAMHHDERAWQRFTVSEAKRLKRFLDLPERAGLDGLEAALALKLNTLSSAADVRYEGDALVYRVVECRVQAVEYAGFANAIDERITCECVSCFPDVVDETCSCAWRFAIDDEA